MAGRVTHDGHEESSPGETDEKGSPPETSAGWVANEPPRSERRRLTHIDRSGRPRMVDVSDKPSTARRAVAEGEVVVSQETLSLIVDGLNPKGDVLSVAELAGVMAGKKTSELIPLCHPLALTDLVVQAIPDRAAGAVRIRAEAATTGPTGVEMEALTAVSVAALTVYDMIKAVERGVTIRSIRLVSKSGGQSGEWQRPAEAGADRHAPRAARGSGRVSAGRGAGTGQPGAGRTPAGWPAGPRPGAGRAPTRRRPG